MADKSKPTIRACAFCGRTEEEVSFLIPAQDGKTYICENCIAVCADFLRWAERQVADYVVVESAILFESGLDKVVDVTVAVVAPKQLCLERAMSRDGATEAAILARMKTQRTADELRTMADFVVENIELSTLLPQVEALDSKWRR